MRQVAVCLCLIVAVACGGDNKNPIAPTPVPAPTPAPAPTPTTAPDLVVDAPTVNDNSPATGAPFTLSATVRNAGDGESAATTLRFYQSTDETITTADTEAGTAAVGELAAGATSSESISLTAPSTAGTYYYGACVDAVTDESDTANNCAAAVQVTVPEPGATTAPDLVVDAPTVNDNSPATGAPFTLSATVRNAGDGESAATTLRFYQSTDETITTADTEAGTAAVGELAAGATSSESISLTAPSTAGTYYYGACVDAVTDESDTANNCAAAVQVTVPEPGATTAPDLVVDAPTVNDNSPATGAPFTLSATVSNAGDGESAATTLRFYQSTDGTITTADTEAGTAAVGGLAAGATSSESISLTAPATAGTYYYGACVDAVTDESNTANNCAASVTVTVPEPPTSPVETQGCPADAETWRGLKVCDERPRDGYARDAFGTGYSSLEDEIIAALPPTMKANGQVYTPYSCLAFDITANGTAATDIEHIVALAETHDSGIADERRRDIASDLDNLTIADPTVNRSQKSDRDAAEWMPARHGAWFAERVIQVKLEYGLSVDPAERDALDALLAGGEAQLNCVGTPPATTSPDLEVVSATVNDSSPATGAPFTLSATVRNAGDGESAATTLRYYRSTDATITPADTADGTDAVVGLVAGATSSESISLTAPSTAGTYYYGACVDAVADESDTANNCSASVQVTVPEPTPNNPPVRAFNNCDAMHSAGWTSGVNRNGGTYKSSWDSAERQTYQLNTARDRDGDGRACER